MYVIYHIYITYCIYITICRAIVLIQHGIGKLKEKVQPGS